MGYMKQQRLSPEYMAEVGNRIKLIRIYLKYDQKQLSKYLQTTQSQLSKVEAGKCEMPLYLLLRVKKLADTDEYLRENLTWSWLLEGKGKGVF